MRGSIESRTSSTIRASARTRNSKASGSGPHSAAASFTITSSIPKSVFDPCTVRCGCGAKISLCDALIVRSGTKVGRDVFEASGGRLRVVGRAGVGIDNVDLAAATEHGCLVVNAPTANTIAAAEHGIALLTAMARNIAQADASLKAGESTHLQV